MADAKQDQAPSPYMTIFEGFRQELDEHHDRRERIVKASRDITAASKKIIFTLQRLRSLATPIPQFAVKSNAPYWETIEKQYQSICGDLQGINAYRYERNITGGNQEFIEALSFQHYLETQTLISYEDATMRIAELSGKPGAVSLSVEDYVLGIFDMTGELMRFSITSMATNGKVPTGIPDKHRIKQKQSPEHQNAEMEVDEQQVPIDVKQGHRTVLDDLREIRLRLEMFDPPRNTKFAGDIEKKADVMRQSVDKVEKALYSLVVRGSERPKGWNPLVPSELQDERRTVVESY